MASDLPGNALVNRETSRIAEREKVIEVPIPVGGGGAAIPAIRLADTPAIGAAPTTIRSDCTIEAFADGGGSIMAEPSLLTGGGPAAGVALWDGEVWVPWGSGADGPVYCCVYSTTEDAFYIGGSFATVDGVACANIARLDCATFAVTPLGAGVDNTVLAIALDEANGLVHAGGEFLNAGGGGAVRVATYNIGAGTWAAWGAGCDNTVYALALDTAVNRCFVGGVFNNAGGAGAAHIAEYAFGGGGVWSEPGGGLDDDVHALVWESVAGTLYIGGAFAAVALHVATWDGANFAQIGDGLDDTVYALAWDAAGGILYAGGAFLQDGTASIDLFRLARYVGGAWGDGGVLGQGDNVNAVCVVGSDLYVGGEFVQHGFLNTHPLQNVCRYINATTPLEMGSGANDTVYEMAADASGRVLVVGLFTIAGGENLPGFINFAPRRDHIHGMPSLATTIHSGFMSYMDKAKLDTLGPGTGYWLLAGRAGGQIGYGGTGAGDDAYIRSTSDATKGTVFLADDGGTVQIGPSITTPQTTIRYDNTNRIDISVTATGDNIINSVGSSPSTAMQIGGVQCGLFSVAGASERRMTVGDGTFAGQFFFDGGAGYVRDIIYLSGGVSRWALRVNSVAESGSAAGSDFNVISRDDAGAILRIPLQIYRATGKTVIGNSGALTAPIGDMLDIWHTSSGTTDTITMVALRRRGPVTAGIGYSERIGFYLRSSTTDDQLATTIDSLWTDPTHASRTALTRGSTTGNTASTYWGHWGHDAVSNSAITIIPNATGDVATVGTFMFAVYDNTAGTSNGGTVTLNPGGGAVTLLSDGTDTLQITCAADGSVTIARSAGTHTFKVSLWGTWY